MSSLSISQHFERLGAPLVSVFWSWGAARSADSAVFLKVWQDQTRKVGDRHFVRLTDHAHFAASESSQGYRERLAHVRAIRDGAASYLVMCLVADPKLSPRKMARFNEREVFVGGECVEDDGDIWVELKARVPVSAVCLG